MTAPLLRADEVVAGFTSTPVVGPLTFECGLGQALAVRGSPGSGKSTVLQMLMGRANILGGSCWLFDQPVRNRTWEMRLWRRPIGAVWNTRDAPDGLTASEVLKLAGAMTSRHEFLDEQVAEWVRLTPLGDRLSNRVSTLSGGERTVLAAACGLARSRGGLLIFDDLTASLQPSVAEGLVAIVKAQVDRQQLAVIFSDDSDVVCDMISTERLELPDA